MREYLEQRITELTSILKDTNNEGKLFLMGEISTYKTILDHWNKQLQITDANKLAEVHINSLNWYPIGAKDLIKNSYIAGWGTKTIQLANISEEEIDAMVDEKYPIPEGLSNWSIEYKALEYCRADYCEGLIDMYNKVGQQDVKQFKFETLSKEQQETERNPAYEYFKGPEQQNGWTDEQMKVAFWAGVEHEDGSLDAEQWLEQWKQYKNK